MCLGRVPHSGERSADPESFGGHSNWESRNLARGWGVSSHQIPPAGLGLLDANSIGGEWIMLKEWINLLTDTQPGMLCDCSFYRSRWSDWREGSGERYKCKLSWWSFYFNLLNALPAFSTVDNNSSKAACHQMFCSFEVFDKCVT